MIKNFIFGFFICQIFFLILGLLIAGGLSAISLGTFALYQPIQEKLSLIIFWLSMLYGLLYSINQNDKITENVQKDMQRSIKTKFYKNKPNSNLSKNISKNSKSISKIRININDATINELKSLPHITDIDAKKIKNYTDNNSFKNIYDFQGFLDLSKEQIQILIKHIQIKKTKKSKKKNKSVIEDIKEKDRNRILDI